MSTGEVVFEYPVPELRTWRIYKYELTALWPV